MEFFSFGKFKLPKQLIFFENKTTRAFIPLIKILPGRTLFHPKNQSKIKPF